MLFHAFIEKNKARPYAEKIKGQITQNDNPDAI